MFTLLLPLILACTHHPATDPAAIPRSPASAGASAALLSSVEQITDLALSPDGATVAFVSDRSGSQELWTLDLSTPASIPVQRTEAHETINDLAWSPDSRTLVFGQDHGGDERADLWTLSMAGAPQRLSGDLAHAEPTFSPDGQRLAFVADARGPFQFDLHLREADGAVRRLTTESANVASPRWSPDGSRLVAVSTPDDQRGELLIVDVGSGVSCRLRPPDALGIAWPVGFLPGGEVLSRATDPDGFLRLAAVDSASGTWRWLGPSGWDVEHAAVAAEGVIVLVRNVRGYSELSRLHPDGHTEELYGGGVIDALSVAGGGIAWLQQTARDPSMILHRAAGADRAVEVVSPVVGALNTLDLSGAALVTLERDGVSLDGFVWTPPVERLGSPPPAVVYVHGGPGGQARPGFDPDIQALAEAGFLVVAPNYRGSTGQGRAFEDLNNHDWGGGDLQDLLAFVDTLVAAGRVDPTRVGITGRSFGGYLTLRAITAAPERFRAAVDLFGISDLIVDYELTRDRYGTWYETEMGTPTTHAALFRDRSPIFAMDRVTAPLLVLQGAGDTDVPAAESELVVEALRKRGHPVEYVLYPDEGHGFTHRVNRVDALQRTVDFFVRHLGR